MATKKRQTLKQRAEAIINDARLYDEDTRHAIKNALKNKAHDLAELVRRAERGDTILDGIEPLAGPAQKEVAVRVRNFIGESIPDFIRDAVVDAIAEAAERTGAPEPEYHAQGYDVDALANLFEVAGPLFSLRPRTPQQALAAHLSAVLKHPDTPSALYNAMLDEFATMEGCVDCHTPDMIQQTLEAFKKHEAAEEDDETEDDGDAEDGTEDDEPELSGRTFDMANLAVFIDTVLKHSDTPRELSEAMVDVLTMKERHDNCRTPTMIMRTLEAFKQQDAEEEAEQAGG